MNESSLKTLISAGWQTTGAIKASMKSAGHMVYCAPTAEKSMELALEVGPDLAILEATQPDGPGLDLCKELREHTRLTEMQILVISSDRSLHMKKRAFESGADCYLPSPIDHEELVLWTRALLRRARAARCATAWSAARRPLPEINLKARLVTYNGVLIQDLTHRELQLFHALYSQSPRVLSREALITEVWRTQAVPNLVDTHLFNLRRKLPPELAAKLRSIPGKGFRYN